MQRSVTLVLLVAAVLSACGGSEPTDSATEVAPASSPTSDAAPETSSPEPAPAPAVTDPPTGEPAPEPTAGAPAATPGAEPAAEEPTPEPDAGWPDDGCSADNSPTGAAAAEGPPPAIALRPESSDSPLPDLAVRRINCKGGWENLRNELPADRPLLVWFWAPH